ncbi:MAG: hypothetical protein ACRBDI_09755 [Alphaproteobacteria bacterium]
MNTKYTTLLLISCAFLSAPIAMAADNQSHIKPHHIKISHASKSNHGITIIKGKILEPQSFTLITPAISKEEPVKSSPSPNIISNRSCAQTHNSNRSVKLADSLKIHLSNRNQDPTLIDDILRASQSVGVDFDLMVVKAMIESDLGRLTKNTKSTASGLFQYIDSTWLTLLKRYGDKIGEPQYAKVLTTNPATLQTNVNEDSQFSREELLALRFNNRIAALIKAHQTKEDANALKSIKNNGIITATDHYIAHMMGIPLAKAFYKTLENESDIILINLNNNRFETAARLNPAFFNDRNGNPLNAQDAYQQFHDKISRRYDALQTIQFKYGNKGVTLTNSDGCNLPSVKTVKL